MYFIDSAGWLTPAVKHPSPNFNSRPPATEISLLVIHNISLPAGQFGGPYVRDLFANCLDCDAHESFADLRGLTVSSHLLIDRAGELSQFVSLADRAWHAGISSFAGRENCNDFSIGIELEGCDNIAYTHAQYQTLIAVSQTLCRAYPAITPARIVGHNEIAPGRKTDPGAAFDWTYFKNALD